MKTKQANKKAKDLEGTQQSIYSSEKKFKSSSSFLRHLWWIHITIKKGCVYNIVFSSPHFFRSFIESTVNQQLLRIYPVPSNLQSAHLLFISILSITSVAISRYSYDRRQVEWNTPFIRIFYSHFSSVLSFAVCLLLCFPSMCSHTFFSSPGFHFYIFSRAELTS